MNEFGFKTGEKEFSRLTAYKVWISDIRIGEFVQQQGIPDYVFIANKQVSRVNVIASVVDTFPAENYASLTLDDGSSQIRLKAFGDSVGKLKEIEAGNVILTIARLRNYNNETYLLPEIIKKVSAKQALLRRLEMIMEHGKREPGVESERKVIVKQAELPVTTVKSEADSMKEKIQMQIAELDEGEGVEISVLREKLPEEEREKLDRIIEDFLSEGEAYEPRPGKIRLI